MQLVTNHCPLCNIVKFIVAVGHLVTCFQTQSLINYVIWFSQEFVGINFSTIVRWCSPQNSKRNSSGLCKGRCSWLIWRLCNSCLEYRELTPAAPAMGIVGLQSDRVVAMRF